jgi:hypothetical protein
MIKKLLKSTLLSIFVFCGMFSSVSSSQNNGYDFSFPIPEWDLITDIPECSWDDCIELLPEIDDEDSIIGQLLSIFWLNNSALSWDHKFIKYVRWILNMALGILSMIALVMTIYTFYMMFFSDNEAWTKKAKGNLIGIFIALAIIWLAWLIVSFIFRWYQSHWQNVLG